MQVPFKVKSWTISRSSQVHPLGLEKFGNRGGLENLGLCPDLWVRKIWERKWEGEGRERELWLGKIARESLTSQDHLNNMSALIRVRNRGLTSCHVNSNVINDLRTWKNLREREREKAFRCEYPILHSEKIPKVLTSI